MERTHERLAELLNVPTTYLFEGKTYKIAEANITQRAEFSQFVLDAANDYAETGLKRGRSQEWYEATLKGIAADKAAQKFEFDGEYCLAAMKQPSGQVMYLYIMLRDEYPEVTYEIAKRMHEAKIREVVESLEKVRSDPKALRGLADLLAGGMLSNGSGTGRKTQSPMTKSKRKPRRK